MNKKTNRAILGAAVATAAAALLAVQTTARAGDPVTFEDVNGAPGDATNTDLGAAFRPPNTYWEHLDIDSVTVSNDASDLYIAIKLVGSPVTNNWGKYVVGFDFATGGDPTSNGWGRQISMSSGMDAWIGSWVDTTPPNGQVWTYDGAWAEVGVATPTITPETNTITLKAGIFDLGLSDNTTILFDVYTTGANTPNGPVDAAAFSGQTIQDWDVHYDSGNNLLSYTLTGVGPPPIPPPTWTSPGGGSWHDGGNWTTGVAPHGPDAQAILGGSISANAIVTTTSDVTLGRITFNSANSYNISGAGSLTMSSATSTARITVQSGLHTINVPLNIASNTRLDVFGGATLSANGLSMTANQRITKAGDGTFTINGPMTNGFNSSIAIDKGTINFGGNLGEGIADPVQRPDLYVSTQGGAGGEANFATSQHLNQFGVNPNGTATLAAGGDKMIVARNMFVDGRLNMNDNDFIVDYSPTEGGSPELTLRDRVKSFRDAPGTAAEITYAVGAGDVAIAVAERSEWGFSTFNGVALDDTAVVGKYTYYGDANLDGKVTSDDYVAVDVGLGVGDSWVQGDFNFSGTVTSDDYVAIDVNLGKGTPTPLAFAELKAEMIALHTEMFGDAYVQMLARVEAEGFSALVPEPGALSLVGLGAVGLLGRRRRRA